MSPALASILQFVGRVLLSAIFIQGGLGKLGAADPTIAYIAKNGLPLPELAYWVAVLVELGGGLLILLGVQVRMMSFILAAFCLATGFLFHFHPGDGPNMVNFMKNLAIAGGFIQLGLLGAGALSIDGYTRRGRV